LPGPTTPWAGPKWERTTAGTNVAQWKSNLPGLDDVTINSPWRSLDNVTITTHSAGGTTTALSRSARLVAEAIAELAATGRRAAAVNARDLGWV